MPGTTRRLFGSLPALALLAITAGSLLTADADARTLRSIRERGGLLMCANPNALPFSSRSGVRRGFEIELGEALAKRLGVALEIGWVIFPLQAGRVDCDVVFDAIVDAESADERHLKLSRPYRSSGVAIAMRHGAPKAIKGFGDLPKDIRVGAIVGSLASVTLGRRGLPTIPFTFEDELVEALGHGELDAALATPSTIGFYNHRHKDAPLGIIRAYEGEPTLRWNIAVGMRKSDAALVAAVDAAIERLLADGTVERIYASYGIEPSPPM